MTPPPGVILAGGRASRMDGADKALLPLGGRSLLAHVIGRLETQAGALAISANGDPARFSDYGLPVLPDRMPDRPGPLAGVLAAMEWAAKRGARQVVTVAVDTPFFPPDLVDRLTRAAADMRHPMALAATPGGRNGSARHPTFGLWPVDLREDLRHELSRGLRKVTLWADDHFAREALFDAGEADPFFNINRSADLETAEALLARGA